MNMIANSLIWNSNRGGFLVRLIIEGLLTWQNMNYPTHVKDSQPR